MPSTGVILRVLQTPYSKSYALIFPDTDTGLSALQAAAIRLGEDGYGDFLTAVERIMVSRSVSEGFVPAYPFLHDKPKRPTRTKPTPRVKRQAPGER